MFNGNTKKTHGLFNQFKAKKIVKIHVVLVFVRIVRWLGIRKHIFILLLHQFTQHHPWQFSLHILFPSFPKFVIINSDLSKEGMQRRNWKHKYIKIQGLIFLNTLYKIYQIGYFEEFIGHENSTDLLTNQVKSERLYLSPCKKNQAISKPSLHCP